MAINLRTGLDYLSALPVDQLNEIAESLIAYMKEVDKVGKK